MKLWGFLFLYFFASIQPIFAQDQKLRLNTFFAYHSGYFLHLENNLRSSDKIISNYIPENILLK